MRKLFIFIIGVLLSISTLADIAVPNTRGIRHGFTLEGINKHSQYVFIAYPINTSRGRPYIEYKVLKDGTIVVPGRFVKGDIYAIKKADFDEKKLTQLVEKHDFNYEKTFKEVPGAIAIALGFRSQQRVSTSSPTKKIVDTYQIVQQKNKKKKLTFTLVHLKTVYTNVDGSTKTVQHKKTKKENKEKDKKTNNKTAAFFPSLFYLGIPVIALAAIIIVVLRRQKTLVDVVVK